MKKKFKIEVVTTNEIEIEVEVDGTFDDRLKEFNKHFWSAEDLSEYLEGLASMIAMDGLNDFHEGYGYVLNNGKLPWDLRETPEEKDKIIFNITSMYEWDNIEVEELE